MKPHLTVLARTALFCISIVLSPFNAYAADENQTLLIHLTNTTQDQLHFDRVASSKPGNEFTIDVKTINPGETAIITAIKSTYGDLEGYLVFNKNSGDTGILHVLDQEQIHFGQPIFSFNGTNLKSTIVSKTRNKNVGPRYLTYLAADLHLFSTDAKQRTVL